MTAGNPFTSTGISFFRFHDKAAASSDYKLRISMASRLWELTLNTIPSSWFHVAITWDSGAGLKYYENGVLKGQATSYTATSPDVLSNTKMLLGSATNVFTGTVSENLQMFWLLFWTEQLSSDGVKEFMKTGIDN